MNLFVVQLPPTCSTPLLSATFARLLALDAAGEFCGQYPWQRDIFIMM
jgi:hypothetical protein